MSPPLDRFCSFGAVLRVGQPSVDCFNFDTASWEKRASAPNPVTTRIGSKAVYDPWSKRVYLLTGLNAKFSSYDPIADQWQVLSNSVYGQYYTTMAVDPKRKIILEVGAGVQAVWDLAQPKTGSHPLFTTGDSSITTAQAPGVQYDPVNDRFVAWHGGADVFVLNMDTKVWTRVNPAATNTAMPPEPVKAGTYGRFRDVPSKNVFVVVNSVD